MTTLEASQRALVRALLERRVPGVEARVFGSRVRGDARPYSDLDLAIVGDAPFPRVTLWALEEDFAASDLPFRVDLVDWNRLSESFRAHIERRYERL